jgi:hypothetical protein
MASDQPTHRRTITIESFDTDGGYELSGRLVDERPWAGDGDTAVLHDMRLTLRIDATNLTITDVAAQMSSYPHEECPSIEPACRSLVGLSITRGYTRAVQERLGRQRGCSHLEFLARALGPAAIQALSSSARRRGVRGRPDRAGLDEGPSWLTNTCHLWAAGGIGFEKEQMGWSPGLNRYPVPSVVELRRRPAEA